MSDAAIRVENLSKRYRIGGPQAQYRTIRETMMDLAAAPARRLRRLGQPTPEDETIWALKDVSFEVERGEVVGIIGRNGAGKTTLLKILSRITEPTEGYAEINGRVGSLLEVGTGFHPELTGRENIYLNGAILGMKRAEIDDKFDEIVAFSEIEKFLDTPVKRYSSGMYVRLAFSVAAHLEPEILLVDEVLAVGDAAFQKKCLGKMEDVAYEGRTVLFVSHNMAAIQALCSSVVLLQRGMVEQTGRPRHVIDGYLSSSEQRSSSNLAERTDRGGDGALRLTGVELCDADGEPITIAYSGQDIQIRLKYECNRESANNVKIAINFFDLHGQFLFVCNNEVSDQWFKTLSGSGYMVCSIPALPLVRGVYTLNLYCTANEVVADHVREAARVVVENGDFFGSGRLPPSGRGGVLVPHAWNIAPRPETASQRR